MLGQKIDKSKNMFEILKYQQLSKRYDELATNKYKSAVRNEDQALKNLEDIRTQNAIVEEILDSIRKENP